MVQPCELPRCFETPNIYLMLQRQRDGRHDASIRFFLVAFGNPNERPIRIDVHSAAAVTDVGEHFHAGPRTRKSREGDGVEAVIDHLLRVSRKQERDAEVQKAEIALMRDGGAF